MSQLSTFTAVQRRALARAARDRGTLAAHLRPVLTLGRDEYRREQMVSCTYGGDDDGYAMLLEVTLRNRVARDTEQKRCTLEFECDTPDGTVRLPAFVGYALRRYDRGYAITAGTGGYEAERTPIGRNPNGDLTLSGVTPDTALFTVLQPLRRRYAGYEIGPLERPLLWRRGADRFTWNMYVKEAADYCAEMGRAVLADTPTNTAFAYAVGPVSRDEAPAWHFEKGVDCDEVGDETPDGERYARVVVHSEPDSTGVVRWLAEVEVDNRGFDVFGGSALMHALEPEVDGDSAGVAAFRLARALGRNDTRVSVSPNYPPFMLRRGDVVSTADKEFHLDPVGRNQTGPVGTLQTTDYLFKVQSMQVDALNLSGELSGEGLLVGRRQRPMTLPEFETGNLYAPLWGNLPDARSGYVDTALPWVRTMDDGTVYLDTDIAAEHGVRIEPLQSGGLWEITDEEEQQ